MYFNNSYSGSYVMTIKSMRLYTNVERIYNELAEIGKFSGDSLSVAELSQFDQLHYHGTDALKIFYSSVDRHFQSGKLGGIRLCAKKR